MQRVVGYFLLGLGAMLAAVAARADLRVQQAAPFLHERILHLNTLLDLNLSSRAEEALHNGIPLEIVVEIKLVQHRWWWTNKVVSDWDVRRRLLFHALSRQYVVSSIYPTVAPQSFGTLEQALLFLGRLDDVTLQLTARKQFYPDARYLVELRARLDIEALPALMRPLAYVTPSWRLSTGWHRWPVQP
jgi:hypothetical protein